MKIPLSPEQRAIMRWLRASTPGDHLAVEAGPGSGKSFTLRAIARRLPPNKAPKLLVAFNNHIVGHLRHILKSTPDLCITNAHSLGRSLLCEHFGRKWKCRVNEGKYWEAALAWAIRHPKKVEAAGYKSAGSAAYILKQLCALLRLTLTDENDPKAVYSTAGLYDLTIPEWAPKVAARLIKSGRIAARAGHIDFSDMLYLPNRWKLFHRRYAWILADEVQDFSPAALALLLGLSDEATRGVWVGDPNQGCYLFAGAGPDSFQHIVRCTNATILPLATSFRCPTSHVALAQEIVSRVSARPGAPNGTITLHPLGSVHTILQRADLVICRRTAPLITLCLQFIAAGDKPSARIRGRDLGEGLVECIEAIRAHNTAGATGLMSGRYIFPAQFPLMVTLWGEDEMKKLVLNHATESARDRLLEQIDCLRALYAGLKPLTWETFVRVTKEVFRDTGEPDIWLSSIHRAKGSEAQRVAVLEYDFLPAFKSWHGPEARVQELNLQYIALTRSKSELVLCISNPEKWSPPEALADQFAEVFPDAH